MLFFAFLALYLPVDAAEQSIDFYEIEKTEIPLGVIPYEVSSEEQALEIIQADMRILEEPSNIVNNVIIPFSTTGDALVDSRDLTFGTLQLRLSYGTSLNGNKGTITFHSPYTQHTGFTLGCVWNQSSIGSQILSSKKDVYAYCTGTMDYYFLVDGLIKLGSSPGNLSGTVGVIR